MSRVDASLLFLLLLGTNSCVKGFWFGFFEKNENKENRRDIAMRWVIRRCVLKRGRAISVIFTASSKRNTRTRSANMRHGRQITDIRNMRFLEIERKSALGLIWVDNRLPQEIVRHDYVKDFQRSLQSLLKEFISSGCDDWKDCLSSRIAAYKHPLQ